MAERSAMRAGQGNGSVGQIADHDAPIGSRASENIEALRAAQGDPALLQRLDRLTREIAESRQRCDQFKAILDKRTRRVQQLIGERDRLIFLLAERDAEVQRLNREFGAVTPRAVPAAEFPPLLAAARAMLERIRPARKAPAPAAPPRMASATGRAPRLEPWVKNGAPKAVLAVVVFGLSEAEIASVLDVVEPYCAEHDLAPLLLTDNDAFQLFRGRRVLFEFLPARADRERLAPELEWRFYTLRRLALIRRKWQPIRVVAFGGAAAEVVRQWLDSPFEATPVPAPLKAQPGPTPPDWSAAPRAEAMQP
jgi:hypothetical protein